MRYTLGAPRSATMSCELSDVSEREAPECGVGRRFDGAAEYLGFQIENINVIGRSEVDLLAALVVKHKLVEARMGILLAGVQKLKRLGGCDGARWSRDGNICFAGRSRRSGQRDALKRIRIAGIERKCTGKCGERFDFLNGSKLPTDGDGYVSGVGTETEAKERDRVTAGFRARVRKDLGDTGP
jgi:hypothetical protein